MDNQGLSLFKIGTIIRVERTKDKRMKRGYRSDGVIDVDFCCSDFRDAIDTEEISYEGEIQTDFGNYRDQVVNFCPYCGKGVYVVGVYNHSEEPTMDEDEEDTISLREEQIERIRQQLRDSDQRYVQPIAVSKGTFFR